MPLSTHKYSRDGVTVIWQPDKCIHSAICARGLPDVFDPRRKPWIDMSNATVQLIIEQVKKCPSGALSLQYDDASKKEVGLNTSQ
ncbi:MAG: (4Fe-4S)-binding protein [Ferruginibacter sp.]